MPKTPIFSNHLLVEKEKKYTMIIRLKARVLGILLILKIESTTKNLGWERFSEK